jgi:hypothetical protein
MVVMHYLPLADLHPETQPVFIETIRRLSRAIAASKRQGESNGGIEDLGMMGKRVENLFFSPPPSSGPISTICQLKANTNDRFFNFCWQGFCDSYVCIYFFHVQHT